MPALLKTLKSKKELVSNEIYLLSAITALLKVAETLPHFLSPYLLDCLLQVSHLTPTDTSREAGSAQLLEEATEIIFLSQTEGEVSGNYVEAHNVLFFCSSLFADS